MPVWPPMCGKTTRLGSRDLVTDAIKCGPHGGKNRVAANDRSLRSGFAVVCPQNHWVPWLSLKAKTSSVRG
jgi:hypothetical protein